MTKKNITLRIDIDMLKAVERAGYSYTRLFEEAGYGLMDGVEPIYTARMAEIDTKIKSVESVLSMVNTQLVSLTQRAHTLEEEIEVLNGKKRELQQASDDTQRGIRISELLREINKAIAYNDYIIPDIEKSVAKQLAEMKAIVPEFSLETQIEIVKRNIS